MSPPSQEQLIRVMSEMFSLSVQALYLCDSGGRRELASIARMIADMIDSPDASMDDCLKIINILAAHNKASLQVLREGTP